jgi:hypothetical protein
MTALIISLSCLLGILVCGVTLWGIMSEAAARGMELPTWNDDLHAALAAEAADRAYHRLTARCDRLLEPALR